MLIDGLSAVQLKSIMRLDIFDCLTQSSASGMAVIRMSDFMLVIDQTKVPIRQLHIVDIPDVPGVIADQSHIIGIRHDHREILPIYRLQFFRGKHAHHLAPSSATI